MARAAASKVVEQQSSPKNSNFPFWFSQNQKEEPLTIKIFDCWVMGFVLKTNCKKKPFIVFHFWEFQKQQQEDIAVSPQYWARAAASKVVEQQASSKISNFPFWFSQNQKTNSILRKGFEIENSIAVMSSLKSHNKWPHKPSPDFNLFAGHRIPVSSCTTNCFDLRHELVRRNAKT